MQGTRAVRKIGPKSRDKRRLRLPYSGRLGDPALPIRTRWQIGTNKVHRINGNIDTVRIDRVFWRLGWGFKSIERKQLRIGVSHHNFSEPVRYMMHATAQNLVLSTCEQPITLYEKKLKRTQLGFSKLLGG